MFFIPIQLKIQCNVKMGPPPPPGSLPAKRGEDAGMSSEDDGLPRSPPEMSLLHDLGPGTTIKASAAPPPPPHQLLHPHPPQRAARDPAGPVNSPKVPVAESWSVPLEGIPRGHQNLPSALGLCGFSFFEQKFRSG